MVINKLSKLAVKICYVKLPLTENSKLKCGNSTLAYTGSDLAWHRFSSS